MENKCYYLSSHGLPLSSDIFILKRNDINNIKTTKNNTIIYLKIDWIKKFINNLHLITHKFILITGLSDITCPNTILIKRDFLNFINNDKLVHWYCQNCFVEHEKITKIPIGLDYHTLKENDCYWGNKLLPIEQESELIYIKNSSKPLLERKLKCYSNFHFSTYGHKFGYDRKDIINIIPKNIVDYEPNKIKRIDTWKIQSEYAFVISPHGNGLDCYRTWEALILGCIVVVKKSPLDCLYDDLPVLILNDWKELNINLLTETLNEFSSKTFNYDKLTLNYWQNMIKSCRKIEI
jgi:hypothetical protein